MERYLFPGERVSFSPDAAVPELSRFSRRARRAGGNETPREGFTLIEMMIVIVILGVLAAIAINLTFKMTGKAYEDTLKSDLSQAYKASLLYHNDHPQGNVTPQILRENGYCPSDDVALTVVDGSMDGLRITATHPGVQGKVYEVDHNGRIFEQ